MALLRMVSKLRGGPRIPPARRAALEELGFNTDMPLFRGTNFDIGKEIEAGRALHVSDSPHYASAYAAGFDNPFDYRPNSQELRAATMSREAHEALKEEMGKKYQEAHARIVPGTWATYQAVSQHRSPVMIKGMQELVKRHKGLPGTLNELMDLLPDDTAVMNEPGANLTWPYVRAIKAQMDAVDEEVAAKFKAKEDEVLATPEWQNARDIIEEEQRAFAKYRNSTSDFLSATPHVAPLYARVKNPRPMVDEMGIMDLHEDPDRVKHLMKKGYDSAIWTPEAETHKEVLEEFGGLANNIHGGEMVVFEPEKQLTGAFADFVPLLKKYGLPITGAGVATLASMLNQQQMEMA